MKGINKQIQDLKETGRNIDFISDGYHTFKELYDFRLQYNAALFNEWASDRMRVLEGMKKGIRYMDVGILKYDVHKSWKHYDGKWCFDTEKKWFIVVAMLPDGQITNHYKAEHWDLFNIPEVDKAKYPFDNHTGQDVLQRLKNINAR